MNNKNKRSNPDHILYDVILSLENKEECYQFFVDLCTPAELQAMEQRFEVARLLHEGMKYNDILELTGASSATISRVNRSLVGGTGTYDRIFEQMGERANERV